MTVDELNNDPAIRDITILQALSAGQYAFGQYQTAIDLLDLAQKLDPYNSTTYVMMSRIQYAIGELEEALHCIDLAVSSASDQLSERDQIFERRIRLLADLAEQQRLLG